jgi:hypothetical protein
MTKKLRTSLPSYLLPEVEDEIRSENEAVTNFLEGIKTENAMRVVESLDFLRGSMHGGFGRALRGAALIKGLSGGFREQMLVVFVRWGDSIRTAAPSDLLLLDFFWAVLPRYDGRAVVLYRGETFENRRRKTYGWSWSDRAEVARGFANGFQRTCRGGSVLIKTRASAAAIISAPALLNNRYGEEEYIVDRRHLSVVEVRERFAQKPIRSSASVRL